MNVTERNLDRIAAITHRWPVKKTIQRIDDATKHGGPSAGMNLAMREKKIHVTAHWDNEDHVRDILVDNKPAIIVFNHPDDLEPVMVLSTLPPKKNLSVIAMGGTEKVFGPEMGEHIIPVYQQPKKETESEKSERRIKNVKSMKEAVERLQSGGSIMIAPDGGEGDDKWRGGAVALVRQARKLDEAYLIMAHVPRTTKKDIGRLLFRRPLHKNIRISDAISVHDIPIPLMSTAGEDRNNTASYSKALENYYDSWVRS